MPDPKEWPDADTVSPENFLGTKFTREELQAITERASVMAADAANPRWRRAYADLAQAASTLDAFEARCTIQTEPGA